MSNNNALAVIWTCAKVVITCPMITRSHRSVVEDLPDARSERDVSAASFHWIGN